MQTEKNLDRDVERLLQLMRDLGRRNSLRDPVATAAAVHEFSPPQIHALLWLGADGALPMNVLAQRVGVSVKTATGLVDRLAESGHVERLRAERDRRVVKVGLTSSGAAAARLLEAGIRQNTRGMLSLLTEADRRSLLRILNTVVQRVEEYTMKKPSRRSAS